MERISYNNNNVEGLNNISNEYNNTYSGKNEDNSELSQQQRQCTKKQYQHQQQHHHNHNQD